MTTPTPPTPPPGPHDSEDISKPLPQRLAVAFMQTFAKGLIAILPVGAFILLLAWFYSVFENFFGTPIRSAIHLIFPGDYYIPGMGFLLGMVLIFLLGLFLNALIVRQLLQASEGLLQRLPLAKTVMSSVRDVTGFFTKSEKRQMNQVVVVNIQETGFKMVGFITRQDLSDLPQGMSGSDMVSVFFPLSYAMGGFTALVPRTRIQPVEMSMEDAMRFVLTAGMKSEESRAVDTAAKAKEAVRREAISPETTRRPL